MSDPPHPTLLNRQEAIDAVTKHYAPQLNLLTEMTNFASNLIPRAFNSSEKQLRDVIVCFSLLKQFTTMLDAVEVLVRQGAVHAAFAPARVAFEASLYIEWMLVSDGEKKATHYFVGNLRDERLWGCEYSKARWKRRALSLRWARWALTSLLAGLRYTQKDSNMLPKLIRY